MNGYVYLLHLSRPIGRARNAQERAAYGLPPRIGPYRPHARHYLGWSPALDTRLNAHQNGSARAARLIQVACAEGISFTLARVWRGSRRDEKRLKGYHNGPQLCPFCREAPVNVCWLEEVPLTIDY